MDVDYRLAFEHAPVGLCVSRSHYEITVEHLLVKLFDNVQADVALLLRQNGVDAALIKRGIDRALEDMRTGNAGKPAFSPLLLELMQDAWLIASVNLGEARIRSGTVLLAFLARASYYATGDYAEPLRALNRESLLSSFGVTCGASIEETPGAGEGGAAGGGQAAGGGEGSAIARESPRLHVKADRLSSYRRAFVGRRYAGLNSADGTQRVIETVKGRGSAVLRRCGN